MPTFLHIEHIIFLAKLFLNTFGNRMKSRLEIFMDKNSYLVIYIMLNIIKNLESSIPLQYVIKLKQMSHSAVFSNVSDVPDSSEVEETVLPAPENK